jgi:Clp amino terminal domain, pathogenicity island component/S1 RNA binding domain
MANELEQFSQPARRALHLAQKAAEGLSHDHIDTQHLLLGLVRERSGIAGRVLRQLGVTPERTAEIVEIIKRTPRTEAHTTSAGKLDLTPSLKQAMASAIAEAKALGHHVINTEHLLLGLIHQSDSEAAKILRLLGLTPDRIRRETLHARSVADVTNENDWHFAEELLQNQEPIEAMITGFNPGGVIIKFGELRGFVPAAQIDPAHQQMMGDERLPPEERFHKLVGQKALIKVIEIDREHNRLILSERAAS